MKAGTHSEPFGGVPRRRARELLVTIAVAALLLPAPAAAQGWQQTSARIGAVTFDILVLRPVAAASMLIGLGAMVPATVLTAPGGLVAIEEAWDVFVANSAKDLATRPLGDF